MSSNPNVLSRQLALLVAAVFAASAALLAFYLISGAATVDGGSLQRDRMLLDQAVADTRLEIIKDQQSITLWDDAVIHTRQRDINWIASNIGLWMKSFFGHDRAYILDAKDRAIYAMSEGHTVGEASFEEVVADVAPLASRVRAKLATSRQFGDFSLSDLGMVGKFPAIIGVSAILPAVDLTLRDPGHEFLHVSVRYLDARLLDRIGTKYLIPKVAYSASAEASPARANLELHDDSGRSIGFVTWEMRRPGWQMVRDTAPAMGCVLLVVLLVVAVLYERLRRSAARLQTSEAHAQHVAFHDSLTNLANRAAFNDTLDQLLRGLVNGQEGFGLLCLDLDRFKEINDTLGHPAGDELIRQVADRFLAAIGPRDLLARLNGDEFAVLTPERDAVDVLAARLIESTEAVFDLFGSPAWIGVSIGAVPIADASLDSAEVMRRADLALYEAKSQGRGRSFTFDASLDALAREKRLLESDLREALETGVGLGMAYQPLFGRDAATVVGAEALVRWEHPQRGSVSPAQFIPLAEERGLISALGAWVIRQSCHALAAVDIPWIAVNVSPIQLKTAGFAAGALAMLAEAGIDPQRVQIEITEGVLIDPTPTVIAALAAFRAAGIRIALDDFGTGYASVQYLARYSVDKIKIDRSFVQHVGAPGASPAIVRAMVELAGALGIAVVAEGVETPAQRDGLIALGCGELQGFLLSRPIGQDELTLLCATSRMRGMLRGLPQPAKDVAALAIDAA